MSESLRLELIPLGIRVVTVVTGIIETNLHHNEPEHSLPANSYYKPIEGWLKDRESGKNRPPGQPVQDFARQFVQKCENGAKGKVYIGPLTPLFVYLKWWMPSFIWVSATTYRSSKILVADWCIFRISLCSRAGQRISMMLGLRPRESGNNDGTSGTGSIRL